MVVSPKKTIVGCELISGGSKEGSSGDTFLWDNRQILEKPIIVLARQAQPTHN